MRKVCTGNGHFHSKSPKFKSDYLNQFYENFIKNSQFPRIHRECYFPLKIHNPHQIKGFFQFSAKAFSAKTKPR